MAILIDGYNLLNATGIDGRGTAGRTELERSRRALLNFLASALTDTERAQTTIVFDAQQAPPGLPSELEHAEMQVRFARGYPSADDLIEELIAASHVPQRLIVVSSDHRLHKAARRRRATALDSDAWISALEHRRPAQAPPASPAASKIPTEASGTQWLAEFGAVDVAAIEAEIEAEQSPPSPPTGDASNSPTDDRKRALDDRSPFPPEFFTTFDLDGPADGDSWNPFPPGYGEDIDADDDR